MGLATLRVGALVDTAARETLEMQYQYTAPCVLDSTAFETTFGHAPTPAAEGIGAVLAQTRSTS